MSLALEAQDWNEFEFQPKSKGKARKLKKIKQKAQRTENIISQLTCINPKTDNQRKVFDYYDQGYHIYMDGVAGTGKTFLSLFLALDEIKFSSQYNHVVIVRSAVPSRDIGHLPGNKAEKEAVYEEPYAEICSELFGRGDAYSILKQKGIIEFTTTSHLRGVTMRDCIVIVDEVQNLDFGELDTIMTRIGENARVIFCGDSKHQADLRKHQGRGEINQFLPIIQSLDSFRGVTFRETDIVRSGLVKEYILERNRRGL